MGPTRVSLKIYRKTEAEAPKAPMVINEEVNCRIQKDHSNRIVEQSNINIDYIWLGHQKANLSMNIECIR